MSEARAVWWKSVSGAVQQCRPAVAVKMRKRYHLVHIGNDCKVRVTTVPLREERYFQDLDMDLKLAKKGLRRVGRRNGITKAAKRLLRG